MVIHTPRSQDAERLVAALRAEFDATVMNFGSYNLLYARNGNPRPLPHAAPADEPAPAHQPGPASVQERAAASPHLLVGYRRSPLEMVLCPVELHTALGAAPREASDDDADLGPTAPALINLTNLAGMATNGSHVEVVLSTGLRILLELAPVVVFDHLPQTPLHQSLDVEDFYDFLDHLMDRVER